jgi:PAS domain S-box-containing protein
VRGRIAVLKLKLSPFNFAALQAVLLLSMVVTCFYAINLQKIWLFIVALVLLSGSSMLLYCVLQRYAYVAKHVQQLQDTQKLHLLLLKHASQGIYGFSSDGNVSFMNPAAQRILGFSEAEMLGQKMHSKIHYHHADGSHYSEADCPLNLTLADGKTRYIDNEVFWHANKTAIYVEYVVAANVDAVGLNGGVVMFSDITELKNKQSLLSQSELRLRQLNHYQEQLREQERSHIAREVHDELGQLLTALRMDTAMLNLKYANAGVDFSTDILRMKSTIDSCIVAVRDVASSLRPAALDMGLLAAANWLLQQFKQRNGLMVTYKGPADELKLDDAKATAVFRVIQESLTNISRHAQASSVSLEIGVYGDSLQVSITDNGCGFDASVVRKKPGFGLMGIRERVMIFGGTARFDSALGEGTTVTIVIPVVVSVETESLGNL